MSLPVSRRFVRIALALGALALACDAAPKDGAPKNGAPKDAAAAQPAAKIGDRTITIAEIDERVKESLYEEATESRDPSKIYELRSAAIDQVVDEALLDAEAKARNLDRAGLLAAEEAKAKPVDDAEVKELFDRFKDRLGDTKFEDVAPQIRERLTEQRKAETRTVFVASLREKGNVAILLEPPRIPVTADGPTIGPADAAVTIVEFSDYQCPYCKRAEGSLKQVLAKYPTQVRLVYRHFPLDGHKDAAPAAEAAACADEQGKFWDYHNLVFESSPKLDTKTLRELAEKSKLDLGAFDACVASGKHKAKVAGDLEAGRAAGVSGTPAFFVNGIPLSGARPLEEFSKLIDRELASPKKPGA
jgi:protein-disulfide isomerase